MIYVLLTDGFEEIEAITPTDILRRAGFELKTVSITDSLVVTGAHDISVSADISLDEVDCGNMEALVLPGGPGHVRLDASSRVHDLIDTAAEKGILIAAICASPSVLGKKGLLSGKRATAFPGFEGYLENAVLSNEKAVKDGSFITARGAGASAEFGFLIVEALAGKEATEKLKESMQY